jgi:hypothetical protein
VSAVAPGNGTASTGARAASRAALDVMLTDAAIEPATVGRLVAPGATARLASGLASPSIPGVSRGARAAWAPS